MGLFRSKRGNPRFRHDQGALRQSRKVRPQLEPLEERWLPSAVFTVNSAGDDPTGEPAGSNAVTLRDAINAVNVDPNATSASPDTIQFAIGSGAQSINLLADLPTINRNVVIDGSTQPGFTGTPLITINGNNSYRLVNNLFTGITINSVIITNGNTPGDGGGVRNDGTLTLTNCTIANNTAAGDGGGVWNDGTLTLTNCTITNNTAGGNGGGLANEGSESDGGSLTVTANTAGSDGGGVCNDGFVAGDVNWVVQDNTAGDNGGGICNRSSLSLDHAVISGNCALGTNGSAGTDNGDVGNGGGIYNTSTLTLANALIRGNSATGTGIPGADGGTDSFINVGGGGGNGGSGGGIFNFEANLSVSSSTISDNAASGTGGSGGSGGTGGLILNLGGDGGDGGCGGGIENLSGTVLLTNVTVANNTAQGTGGDGGNGGTNGGPGSFNSGGTGGDGGCGSGIHSLSGSIVLTDVTVASNQVLGGTAGAAGAAGTGGPNSMNFAGAVGSGGSGGGLSTTAADSASLALMDTIIAANTAPTGGDVAAPSIQADYSLIGDGSGLPAGAVTGLNGDPVGDQIGSADSPINPLLGPLGNNDGSTPTMALLPGSPAIGTGGAATDPITNLPVTADQRGFSRPGAGGAAPDIGAFQDRGYTLTAVGATSQVVAVGQTFPLAVQVVEGPDNPLPGVTVHFTVQADGSGAGATLSAGSAVTDSNGQASITATANATPGILSAVFSLINEQPVTITSASSDTFLAGTAGSFTVTTAGFPAPPHLSESGALPANVTFVDQGDGTAILSGTPAAGTGGIYTFIITAANADNSLSTSQSFTLTVDEAPTITSLSATTFRVGAAGSFTVTTSGGFPAPPHLSESGALPANVTFVDQGDGTAILSGTPAAGTGGIYTFIITAANADNSVSSSQLFTLSVPPFPTSITSFVSSANPSVPRQPVTFTATVSTPVAGAGTPTGSINFFDQTTHTDLGAATLVDGVATLTTSALVAPINHTLTATYTNTDGNFTPPGSAATLTQRVCRAVREPGPALGQTVLYVGSPPDSNHIQVLLTNGQVVVKFHDGSPDFQTPLAGLTGLVIYGGGDDEHIQVDPNLKLPAILFAGDGTDIRIQGGGGPTVEVGGKGGGTLQAGTGRAILIAGPGGSKLIGNGSDTILIGGCTNYDNNLAALQALLAEWSSPDSFPLRTGVLADYLNATTVHDNGVANRLKGGGGQDWFFALLGGPNKDKLRWVAPYDIVAGIH